MKWDDVVRVHGSRAAIVKKDGKISSVLCGGAGHDDLVYDDRVIYFIPNRKYYLPTIKLFFEAQDNKYSFRIFQKLKMNVWRDLGFHYVSEMNLIEEQYKLNLIKLKDCS